MASRGEHVTKVGKRIEAVALARNPSTTRRHRPNAYAKRGCCGRISVRTSASTQTTTCGMLHLSHVLVAYVRSVNAADRTSRSKASSLAAAAKIALLFLSFVLNLSQCSGDLFQIPLDSIWTPGTMDVQKRQLPQRSSEQVVGTVEQSCPLI